MVGEGCMHVDSIAWGYINIPSIDFHTLCLLRNLAASNLWLKEGQEEKGRGKQPQCFFLFGGICLCCLILYVRNAIFSGYSD